MNQGLHATERRAGCGLARLDRPLTALAGLVVGLAGLGGAAAGEPGAVPVRPIPAAELATPPSPGPLRGTMRLNPSKFAARATQSPAVSVETVQSACNAIDKSRLAQALANVQNKEGLCAAASYSVEDQRTAGCSGTDTVDQCQAKLYAYCMDRGGDREAFRNAANQELNAARRARDLIEAYSRYVENTLALHGGQADVRPSLPQLPRLPVPLAIR